MDQHGCRDLKKAAAKKGVGQRHLKLDSTLSTRSGGAGLDQETGQDTRESTGPEFLHAPVASVTVQEQIRSNINIETDSFKALVQSINDRGILDPLLVTSHDGSGYTLLCGERRLLAARQLGLETVPVRVVDGAEKLHLVRNVFLLSSPLSSSLQMP